MKALLVVLSLALAALAIPSSSAALGAPCHVNQGNDTVCHVEAAGCSADTYSYDVEDALNHYQASCLCVHYDNYGRPALRVDCFTPPPIASAAAAPVQCTLGPTAPGGDTHCEGSVGPCQAYVHVYDVEDALNQYRVSCFGCGVALGGGGVDCPLIGPMDVAAAAAAPEPIRTFCWAMEDGSGCTTIVTTGVGSCSYSSGSVGGVPFASVSCSPDGAGSCDISLLPTPDAGCSAVALATAEPEFPCTAGFAQTWCDVTVGPCDVRLVPWTAWGDQYVVSDCRVGGGAGATCHTEVHTQDPLDPVHYCAF